MHDFLSNILNRTPQNTRKGHCAPVADFLQANENLSGMLPNVNRLLALQNACQELMPEYFSSCTILKFEKEKLLIGVPGQAAAARLRQKIPLLQTQLENAGWPIKSIRLKVRLKNRERQWQAKEKEPLPDNAIHELEKLEAFLSESGTDSALINAVHAMVKRHEKT